MIGMELDSISSMIVAHDHPSPTILQVSMPTAFFFSGNDEIWRRQRLRRKLSVFTCDPDMRKEILSAEREIGIKLGPLISKLAPETPPDGRLSLFLNGD